jgi:hypothetical protein
MHYHWYQQHWRSCGSLLAVSTTPVKQGHWYACIAGVVDNGVVHPDTELIDTKLIWYCTYFYTVLILYLIHLIPNFYKPNLFDIELI